MADVHATPPSPHPEISFPLNRPKESGAWTPELDALLRAKEASTIQSPGRNALPRAFYPGGDRSLSGIAIRAFGLGGGAALSFTLAAFLVFNNSHLWRPAFFFGTLCVFHFLEFWTTAEYNTTTAYISSFLISNGSRYRTAHNFAFAESLLTSYFFPQWQGKINPPWTIALGVFLIIASQVIRSLAMVQAGTNFNHHVQSQKKDDHELVTSGLYQYFRHPSYFGFFWWCIGTQLAVGNAISLPGFAVACWYFFKTRIAHEEKHLVEFFGKDYEDYRKTTKVWIPFV